MKKWFLSLSAAVLFMTTACGGGESNESAANGESEGDGESYTFEIGHTMAPEFSVARGYEALNDILQENSDGKIKLEIYDSGSIGASDNENLDAVNSGVIDMASVSNHNLTAVDPNFNVTALPHLFQSSEDWETFWDSEVGDELRASLEDKGYKLLMFSEYGFRQVAANDPIKVPEDLQGLNLRSTDAELEVSLFDSVGANAVPMGWAEVYTGLNQGTVDGQANAVPLMVSAQHHEVLSNVTLNNWTYTNMLLLMDLDEYNNLPEDVRNTLEESIEEAMVKDKEFAAEDEEKAIQAFKDEGAEIYTPTDEEMNEWVNHSKSFWEENLDLVGEDLLKRSYETIHGEELDF